MEQDPNPAAAERLRRIRYWSRLLDSAFRIPGTRFRIGLDGLLGLIPGVGDAATTACSLYLIAQAAHMGAPRPLIWRMLLNVGIDFAAGSIPIAGDVFDVIWKANRKNLRLLEKFLETKARIDPKFIRH